MNNIDLLIKSINGKYYQLYLSKRNHISSEEDLRVGFSSLIDIISKENGIVVPEEHHEYTVLKGRIDSLYGQVIIEYKEPNYIDNINLSQKNRKAIEQVQRHIIGIEKRQKVSINRYLGVVFDGYKVIFVRRRNNLWDVETPVSITEKSFKLLLQRIFSTGIQGKALIIDNLIKDFSIASTDISDDIKSILLNFDKHNLGKVNLLFEQWKTLFREVCGYDFKTKKSEIKELKKTYGLPNEIDDLPKIIFAIQTYYAIFIKLLGAETLTYFRNRSSSFISSLSPNNFKNKIEALESGEVFKTEGVNNFNEGDFFSWYLLSWDSEIEKTLQKLVLKLKDYDFSSLNLEPKEAKDLIKNIYHYLLPQKLRHSLGEYYTPDWLAEKLLKDMQISFDKGIKVLDPTCGSGTFLSALIDLVKQNESIPDEQKLKTCLESIVGIDLNPLAVISAKTNYIIALSNYLGYIDEKGIEIPIYLSDSLLAPLEYKSDFKTYYSLPTKVGLFNIPVSIVKQNKLDLLLNLVIDSVSVELDLEYFINKYNALELGLSSEDNKLNIDLYSKILDLQKSGLDGIWAKIIKNIFAPTFFEDFDFIVGNPPWINWQSLPEDYRNSIKQYWDDYKVFLHKGLKARLGSAHDDISVLLTYVVMDKYLKKDGFLGFVMPQNLLQASGGGEGFRRFKIKEDTDVKVIAVDDFVSVQPFADIGASNKPAIIYFQKGSKTLYPIKYRRWSKKGKGTIPSDQPWNAIMPLLNVEELTAAPIKEDNISSSWLISTPHELPILRKLIGSSSYKARKGVDFSLNGLYWGNIKECQISNTFIFSNEYEIGKKKVLSYESPIEKNLIFPVLRGKDVTRWNSNPQYYAIVPYTEDARCLSVEELKDKYPYTYKYFYNNDAYSSLIDRGIYQKHLKNASVPAYGLYDIGKYTFQKYKVIWKALASGMISCVISEHFDPLIGSRMIIPDHNLLTVSFDDEHEAHYLCALLNSTLVNKFVTSYISWFYSSHILENLNIPKYSDKNLMHSEIAELSKKAHNNSKLTDTDLNRLNTLSKQILNS